MITLQFVTCLDIGVFCYGNNYILQMIIYKSLLIGDYYISKRPIRK